MPKHVGHCSGVMTEESRDVVSLVVALVQIHIIAHSKVSKSAEALKNINVILIGKIMYWSQISL